MSALHRLERLQWPLLVAICLVGSALAIALAIDEAGEVPPLEVIDTADEIDGRRISVVVEVENHTAQARCPEIRVAARDRDTRDLAEVIAQPSNGEVAIRPGATATYEAVIVELTEREMAEDLDDVRGYVARDDPC